MEVIDTTYRSMFLDLPAGGMRSYCTMKKILAYVFLSLSILLAGFSHAGMAHHAPASHHDGMTALSADSGSMQKTCVEPCVKDNAKDCCGGAVSHCESNLLGSSQLLNGSSKISAPSGFYILNAQRFGVAQAFDPPPPKT